MPTYEYECAHCGHKFEFFQKITDRPLNKCPKCNKTVRRLIGSGSGIIFKGSGFYATDYPKKTRDKGREGRKTVSGSTCQGTAKGCDGCSQNINP